MKTTRIQSIDLLRGIVMVIMALDHVRDYFHYDSYHFDPTDLEKTTPVIFFTRWITHFCAPVFVFLAGTSAFMVCQKKDTKATAAFLFKRGIWLLILEVTLVSLGWSFSLQFSPFLQVIWAIGGSMVLLSALIFLPKKLLFLIGIVLVVGHNALDYVEPVDGTLGGSIWMAVHEGGLLHFPLGIDLFVFYPLLPWTGIMLLGFVFGRLYQKDISEEKRKKILLSLGSVALLIFAVLRYSNLYGDPNDWATQPKGIYTFLSFLNVDKYPPSLLYTLMTLGPALIFLGLAENLQGKLATVMVNFGRVPLFYYLAHLYLIHSLAILNVALFFPEISPSVFFISDWDKYIAGVQNYGFSLGGTYLVWILVVVLLYYPCKKYAAYKAAHPEKWWLSYM